VLSCQLAMLKFMADRGLFVATVGLPLAKCNNGNNNNMHMTFFTTVGLSLDSITLPNQEAALPLFGVAVVLLVTANWLLHTGRLWL
jgi:hypothetical protein